MAAGDSCRGLLFSRPRKETCLSAAYSLSLAIICDSKKCDPVTSCSLAAWSTASLTGQSSMMPSPTMVPPTLRFDRERDAPCVEKSDISPMDMEGSDMSSKPSMKDSLLSDYGPSVEEPREDYAVFSNPRWHVSNHRCALEDCAALSNLRCCAPGAGYVTVTCWRTYFRTLSSGNRRLSLWFLY